MRDATDCHPIGTTDPRALRIGPNRSPVGRGAPSVHRRAVTGAT